MGKTPFFLEKNLHDFSLFDRLRGIRNLFVAYSLFFAYCTNANKIKYPALLGFI